MQEGVYIRLDNFGEMKSVMRHVSPRLNRISISGESDDFPAYSDDLTTRDRFI